MTLTQRRRAIMASASKIKPNGFIEGTYTNGTSAWSVNSAGEITITTWSGGWQNALTPKIMRYLDILPGDSVRVIVRKVSGTISRSPFVTFTVNNLSVLSNESWKKEATAVDKTFTATANPSSTQFYINNITGNATITNYKVRFEIFCNGKKIFPLP